MSTTDQSFDNQMNDAFDAAVLQRGDTPRQVRDYPDP
jgi:hypothetical protein